MNLIRSPRSEAQAAAAVTHYMLLSWLLPGAWLSCSSRLDAHVVLPLDVLSINQSINAFISGIKAHMKQ